MNCFSGRAAALAVLLAASSLRGQGPAHYFPLEEGNHWQYEGVGRLVSGAEVDLEVVSRDGDFAVVRIDPVPLCFLSAAAEYRLKDGGDEIDLEIPGRGFVPYYRFQEDSFTHADLCSCDDARVFVAASRDERVVTDAGEFTCLRLDFKDPGSCRDAGKFSEWWAPGVGLVKWEEQTFAGPGAFLLKSYAVGGAPRFRRGDSDASGTLDLSDPVGTLGSLFLGSGEPPCVDAADADDNGSVEISDPIFTLTFLFLGGASPPPPFPECGTDPSADALGCAAFGPCE